MNQTERWYVIFTKQQCERKVLTALSKRGYDCYCPYHNQETQWKNQDKTTEQPLFASFVFVYCSETHFPDIKKTPGVINLLYRFDRPAVVDKEDIRAIEYAVGHYRKIELLKTGLHAPETPVLPEDETYTHSLHSLGYTLVATKEKTVASTVVINTEHRRGLQRLSYRFKIAWR